MIDVMLLVLMLIAVGGVLICVGVFFMPVGGAPAAMGTATGVATGCEMMAFGAGVTGLLMATALYNQPLPLVIVASGVSSSIMMSVTMLVANMILVYGKGVPPALATRDHDPVTKEFVKPFVTPGTVGHGIPTACYMGGAFGGFLAGAGGALAFTAMYRFTCGVDVAGFVGLSPQVSPVMSAVALSIITAVGLYLINANITAYSIRGVIESWLDPKFRRLPKVMTACLLASLLFGVLIILASMQVGG